MVEPVTWNEQLAVVYPFLLNVTRSQSLDTKAAHALLDKVELCIKPTSEVLDVAGAESLDSWWGARKEENKKRTGKENPPRDKDRWPYFYALPPAESEFVNGSLVKMMPFCQQWFVKGIAPRNKSLLELWMHTFKLTFSLRENRDDDRSVLRSWAYEGYAGMRAVLENHPGASKLTDLLSMVSIVQQGLASSKASDWRLYDRFFMPGPERIAVPLPSGLVLFEGRGLRASPVDILSDRVRLAPFSTSWHPNEAMRFTYSNINSWTFDVRSLYKKRANVLFTHKIMSDGILGVDVQLAVEPGKPRLSTWTECEIIIQPLVRIHLVGESVIGIDNRTISQPHHDLSATQPLIQRVLFTHLFLGSKCPCGLSAEIESESDESGTESE